MNDTFARAGLEKVYTNFADAEPDMAMAFKIARRTSITIMQFYVPQVLEEAYRMRWRELLNGALHRGCQLSVLILDPNEDEIICRRSRQIGREPQDFRRKIEQSIQYFEGLRASPSFSSRIDITLFRAYLVGPLLIIGDAAYQGFFSPGKDGLELPWLRIRRSTSTTLKDLWLAPERIIQELGPVNRPHLPKTGSNAPTQPRRRSVSRPR